MRLGIYGMLNAIRTTYLPLRMQAEDYLNVLIDARIVKATSEDEMKIDEGFIERISEKEKRLLLEDESPSWDGFFQCLPDRVDLTELNQAIQNNPTFGAVLHQLHEEDIVASFDQLVQLSLVIDRFIHPPEETNGSPREFLPIRHELLPIVMMYDSAILYFWNPEIDECNEVRRRIESVTSGIPDHVSRFSAFVPKEDGQSTPRVDSLPALVLISGGSIDTRLLGSYSVDTIEREIRKSFDE